MCLPEYLRSAIGEGRAIHKQSRFCRILTIPQAKRQAAVNAMAGHDMGSGGVKVSPERQQLMGIRTATAEIRPMVQKIRTVGIVTYDETRLAQVFSKVEGWIEELLVNYTGTLVRKGQPLFTLYSPDLVATQDEYLLALKAKQTLGSSSIKEIQRRIRLRFWNRHTAGSAFGIFPRSRSRDLEKTGKPKRNLTFYSPLGGFVLKKEAVQGMRVMPDKELYTIADLSTVWVNADIYEYELANIRVGQKATISSVLTIRRGICRQGCVDLSGSRRKNPNSESSIGVSEPRLYA